MRRLGESDGSAAADMRPIRADQIDEERRYARALVFILLTTGLRISDAVNLGRTKVFTDRETAHRLRLRTEKTGVMVTLRLPDATVRALKTLPLVSDELFFWKGGDETPVCDRLRPRPPRDCAARRYRRCRGCAPARFRDTWAKTALLNGAPMRTVQLVLGHKSIRTTETHYAPFVPEYQNMIDDRHRRRLPDV